LRPSTTTGNRTTGAFTRTRFRADRDHWRIAGAIVLPYKLGINDKLFSKPVLSSRGMRRLPGSDLLVRDRSTMAHDPMKHQPN